MNQNYIEKFVIQEFLEEKLFKKDGWIKKGPENRPFFISKKYQSAKFGQDIQNGGKEKSTVDDTLYACEYSGLAENPV